MKSSVANNAPLFCYSLNYYDFMLLTTAALAVLLIIPLLIKRDRGTRDLLLAAFIFSQGATSFFIVMLYSKVIGPSTMSMLNPFHFFLLIIPYGLQGFLLLWYSQTMAGGAAKLHSKDTFRESGGAYHDLNRVDILDPN